MEMSRAFIISIIFKDGKYSIFFIEKKSELESSKDQTNLSLFNFKIYGLGVLKNRSWEKTLFLSLRKNKK